MYACGSVLISAAVCCCLSLSSWAHIFSHRPLNPLPRPTSHRYRGAFKSVGGKRRSDTWPCTHTPSTRASNPKTAVTCTCRPSWWSITFSSRSVLKPRPPSPPSFSRSVSLRLCVCVCVCVCVCARARARACVGGDTRRSSRPLLLAPMFSLSLALTLAHYASCALSFGAQVIEEARQEEQHRRANAAKWLVFFFGAGFFWLAPLVCAKS